MKNEKNIQNYELEMKKEAINVIINDIIPELKEIVKVCGISIMSDSIYRVTIIGPSDTNIAVTLEGFNITWENIIYNIVGMFPKYQLDLIIQILLDFENRLMDKYDNIYIFYNDLSNPGIVLLGGIVEKKLLVVRNNIAKENSEIFERLMDTYDDMHESVFKYITENVEANGTAGVSYYISNNYKIILKTVRDYKSRNNLYLEIFILKKNIRFKKFRDEILDLIYNGELGDKESLTYIKSIGVIDFKSNQFQVCLSEMLFRARRITEKYLKDEKDNNQTT